LGKERKVALMRRIISLLVATLLMVALAANVALAAQPEGKGQGEATDSTGKDTGEPTDPNGFGTVTSQLGAGDHSVGDHSSGFAPGQDENTEPAQRLGVGNVSRTDSCSDAATEEGCVSLEDVINDNNLDPDGPVTDTGGKPGDHAALIDGIDGNPDTDVSGDPGNPDK
jgi:hypothetical protein